MPVARFPAECRIAPSLQRALFAAHGWYPDM